MEEENWFFFFLVHSGNQTGPTSPPVWVSDSHGFLFFIACLDLCCNQHAHVCNAPMSKPTQQSILDYIIAIVITLNRWKSTAFRIFHTLLVFTNYLWLTSYMTPTTPVIVTKCSQSPSGSLATELFCFPFHWFQFWEAAKSFQLNDFYLIPPTLSTYYGPREHRYINRPGFCLPCSELSGTLLPDALPISPSPSSISAFWSLVSLLSLQMRFQQDL